MGGGFADLVEGNAAYAEGFRDPGLPGRAGRGVAVVTCMDARVDPLRLLGLEVGDAIVLRNPGAQVTDDVLTALIVSTHLLGVERVLVLPHTDCRMTKLTEDELHAAIDVDTTGMEFGTIADQRGKLAADVSRLRSSPQLPPGLPVLGGLYDVTTGRIEVVVPD